MAAAGQGVTQENLPLLTGEQKGPGVEQRVRKFFKIPPLDRVTVKIAGEEVILDEGRLDPRRYQHYNRVGFRAGYFPEFKDTDLKSLESDDDYTNAKEAFKRVFGSSFFFNPNNPLPPCDEQDRSLILDGIKNRIETLGDELLTIYRDKGQQVTADLRGRIDILNNLKKLEAFMLYKMESGECRDYNDRAVTGDQLAVSGDKNQRTKDQEELQSLLRQFTLLFLHDKKKLGSHPQLDEPSKMMMAALRKDTMDEVSSDAYLQEWRATPGPSVPPILAEMMELARIEEGAVDKTVQGILAAEYQSIENRILDAVRDIKRNDILDEYGNWLTGLGDRAPHEKIVPLFNWFVELLQRLEAEKKAKETELDTARLDAEGKQGIINELAEALSTMTDEQTELQKQLAAAREDAAGKKELEAEVARLQEAATAAAAATAALKGKLAEAEAAGVAAIARYEEVQAQVAAALAATAAAEAARQECEAGLTAARGQIAAQEGILAEKNGLIDEIQKQLAAATAAAAAAEAARVAAIAERDKAAADVVGLRRQIEELQSGKTATAAETAKAAGQIADLTAELNAAKERASAAEAAAATATAAAAAASAAKTDAEQAAAAAAAAAAEKTAAADTEAGAAKAEAAAEIAAANARAEAAEAKAAQAEAKAMAATTAIQKELDRITAQNDAARAELEALKAKTEQTGGQLAAKNAELVAQLASGATNTKALEAEINRLIEEKAAIEDECEETSESLAQMSRKREECENTLAAANAAAAAAKAEAEAARAAAKEAEERVRNMERALAEEKNKRVPLDVNPAVRGKLAQTEAQLTTAREQLKTTAAERNAAQSSRAALLAALGDLADKGPDYVAPAGLNQNVNSNFAAIMERMQKAKQEGIEAGVQTATTVVQDPGDSICFLSFFTTFFVKLLFYYNPKLPQIRDMHDSIRAITDAFIQRGFGIFGAGAANGDNERAVIYKLLTNTFRLLYTAETFYINKQDLVGGKTTADDVGANFIFFADEDGEADANFQAIVAAMEGAVKDTVKDATRYSAFTALVRETMQTISMKLPRIHFVPKLNTVQGDRGGLPTLMPGFLYLPNGELSVPTVLAKHQFQQIEMEGSAGQTLKPLKDAYDVQIEAEIRDDSLRFEMVLCIFIELSRRYLNLPSIQAMLNKKKCFLPTLATDAFNINRAAAIAAERPGGASQQPTEADMAAAEAEQARVRAAAEAAAAAAARARQEAEEVARRLAEEEAAEEAAQQVAAQRAAEEEARRRRAADDDAVRLQAEEQKKLQDDFKRVSRNTKATLQTALDTYKRTSLNYWQALDFGSEARKIAALLYRFKQYFLKGKISVEDIPLVNEINRVLTTPFTGRYSMIGAKYERTFKQYLDDLSPEIESRNDNYYLTFKDKTPKQVFGRYINAILNENINIRFNLSDYISAGVVSTKFKTLTVVND